MTRQAIIDRTIEAINRLPEEKAEEISDFADFIARKHEEQIVRDNIKYFIAESNAFDFLNEEEEIYSIKDLKERF